MRVRLTELYGSPVMHLGPWWSVALRQPVPVVLVSAVVLHVVVVIGLTFAFDGPVVPDEARYSRFAALLAEGDGEELRPAQRDLVRGAIGFVGPVAALYALVGESLVLARVLVALVGAGAIAVTTVFALRELGPRAALVAGLALVVLPSHTLWSALVLKDAFVWLGSALVALAVSLGARRPTFVAFAVASVGLALLASTRGHAAVVALVAAVATLLAFPAVRQRLRPALVVAAVISVGALATFLGREMLGSQSIAGARAAKAEGCAAFDVQETTTWVDEALRLPAALLRVVVGPTPLHRCDGLRWASLEGVVWIPLVALATLGAARALARSPTMLFPILSALGTLTVLAVAEGNLGTAYRHRAEVHSAVALLAAVGAGVVSQWWVARREGARHRDERQLTGRS